MKVLRYFLVLLVILGTAGWAAGGVIPEMEECMRSHTTPQEYEAVIKKYADPGIVQTEKKGEPSEVQGSEVQRLQPKDTAYSINQSLAHTSYSIE